MFPSRSILSLTFINFFLLDYISLHFITIINSFNVPKFLFINFHFSFQLIHNKFVYHIFIFNFIESLCNSLPFLET